MPNHVTNRLRMKNITSLTLFTTDENGKTFDFNKIIPMPKELDVESSTVTDNSVIYYVTMKGTIPFKYISETHKSLIEMIGLDYAKRKLLNLMETMYTKPETEKDKLFEQGRVYVENFERYGATTWYDWCTKNWGTKWNAYSYGENSKDEIEFNTAWSAPEPVLLKLSEMYPDTPIEHWWADEDTGHNTGHCIYQNGKVIEGGPFEDCSNEAYELNVKLKGYNPCLAHDENGNWVEKDCDECDGCD